MKLVLIDGADWTEVGYVCLWEYKYNGSKFLNLFNSCYHMVGRSSEVSLSEYIDIRMETVHDKNRKYCVAVQVID